MDPTATAVTFCATAGALAVLQGVAWGTNARPYTAHAPLTLRWRVFYVFTFAMLHPRAVFAVAARFPSGAPPGWYLLCVAFLAAGQLYQLWVPYLLGAYSRRTASYFREAAPAIKLLPPLRGRPAPSAVDTVTLPLTLAALASGVALFTRQPRGERVAEATSLPALVVGSLALVAAVMVAADSCMSLWCPRYHCEPVEPVERVADTEDGAEVEEAAPAEGDGAGVAAPRGLAYAPVEERGSTAARQPAPGLANGLLFAALVAGSTAALWSCAYSDA